MNDTVLLLKKISNRMECNRNRSLKELGLTATQLDLLYYLYKHRGKENTLSDITSFFRHSAYKYDSCFENTGAEGLHL